MVSTRGILISVSNLQWDNMTLDLRTSKCSMEGWIILAASERELRHDGTASRAASEQHDVVWITSERISVCFDPLEREPLVKQPSIGGAIGLDIATSQKAEQPKAILHRDKYCISVHE